MRKFISGSFGHSHLVALVLLVLSSSSLMAEPYRGAEYRTIESYRYGRFEVRMQAAGASGVVSSLFTYHELGAGGLSEWNEIDIEFLGNNTNGVQFNTITSGQVGHVHFINLPYDAATEFHDYAFEWTPAHVAWFVDGVEVYRQYGAHIIQLNRYQKMMMNIWQPEYVDWVGPFSEDDLPVYAYYDWARHYAWTPNEGDAGTDSAFTLHWHDDFDSWDMNRWQKASHTWDGNNAQFIPANAVLQDGFLILCLTMPDALGYDGPPLDTDKGSLIFPQDLQIYPAYPNPFNAGTQLRFNMTAGRSVQLQVVDLQGRIHLNERIPSVGGNQSVSWMPLTGSGQLLPSGVYIAQFRSGNQFESQRLLLLQ